MRRFRVIMASLGAAGATLIALSQPAPATFGYYSAIAGDPISGAWGWSTGWLFQNQAEADALRRCQSNPNGSHCRVALVFNSCGAVTTGSNGSYFGVGLTSHLANSRAMNACGNDSNRDCKIIISFCSAEGQAPAPGVPTPPSTPTPPTPPPHRACPYGTHPGLGGCYGD
jgi:hypothetical protein